MLFHLSPQVVAIVENIWLVVAASIVLVFCLVFVMPEGLLLGQDHSLVLISANFYPFLMQQQLLIFPSEGDNERVHLHCCSGSLYDIV